MRERLGLLGVTIEEIEQANATEAAGTVLAQDPPAGTQVEPESTVRIIISAGVDRIPVPDMRNKYFAFAQQELAGSGLRGVVGIKLTNDSGKCGTIASQNPEPRHTRSFGYQHLPQHSRRARLYSALAAAHCSLQEFASP